LLEHGYVMENVDKTLFTLKHGNDFLLVQIYVDDIVFSGSSHSLVSSFQEMMENEFQMSMMGELTFFLGIQVKQMKQSTFIHQAKYMKDLMKKFNMDELKSVLTPMSMGMALNLDENDEVVDQREYRSMIGSLLYLTVTQPDNQFAVCQCARFQSCPRSSHWTAVQRIFKYLRHTPEFGIWYSASSSLGLVGFSDTDFVGCGIDQKSTSATCHFLGSSLVCWSS
jgi:isopentenyldiphosphate isomerase